MSGRHFSKACRRRSTTPTILPDARPSSCVLGHSQATDQTSLPHGPISIVAARANLDWRITHSRIHAALFKLGVAWFSFSSRAAALFLWLFGFSVPSWNHLQLRHVYDFDWLVASERSFLSSDCDRPHREISTRRAELVCRIATLV